MTKNDFHIWYRTEVTQELLKTVEDIKDGYLEDISSFSPGSENFIEQYFYLKGLITGIRNVTDIIEEIREDAEEDVRHT